MMTRGRISPIFSVEFAEFWDLLCAGYGVAEISVPPVSGYTTPKSCFAVPIVMGMVGADDRPISIIVYSKSPWV